jgi:hypothetical protein
MHGEKEKSESDTTPDLPANAFILDPETYKIRGGKLEFSDSPASQKSRRWGYIFMAVATSQFLFFILTARNSGSVVMAVIIGAFLGLIGYILVRNGQQANELKKSGRVIVGELVSIEGRLIEHTIKKKHITSYLIIAAYKYLNPAGAEQTGTITFERNDLLHRRLPYPGAPVIVLYQSPRKAIMC